MPKSSKKRKDKAADFSKAKLKLGKGKQVANNAVDTSFKARAIALPSQKIAVETNNPIHITKRRLTFQDLLAHLKHYSAGTRRDAIFGLRELLDAYPELITPSLTPLLKACARVIGDEDASVRKTMLSFLTWLLPHIAQDDLIPHSSLLMLFTTSAQSHIFPEIRIDAIHFLDLFLERIPNVVVEGWTDHRGSNGNLVLKGYLGILNAGTNFRHPGGSMKATTTAGVVLSLASKAIVLKSFSNFLRNALSSLPNTCEILTMRANPMSFPTWYSSSSFAAPDTYDTYDQPSKSSPHQYWRKEASGVEDFVLHHQSMKTSMQKAWTLEQLSDATVADGFMDAQGECEGDLTLVSHLAHAMHSTLLSTFLDCAPVVFAPGIISTETEVQLLAVTGEIARSLYSFILQSSGTGPPELVCDELRTLLGYMTTYFPFRVSNLTNRLDIQMQNVLQDLNIIFCELTSLLTLTSNPFDHSQVSRRKSRSNIVLHSPKSFLTAHVSEYIVQLLKDEAVSSQLGRLTPTSYTSLLPTIWSLLNWPAKTDDVSCSVLRAVVEHATKLSSNAALKKPATEFLARVVLLETEPQYQGNFRISRKVEAKGFDDWLNHLPKTLWELGSNNLALTEIILHFLLRLFQRKPCILHSEVVASIRSRLVPYFCVNHAIRGHLLGPYSTLLGSPLSALALNVVAVITSSTGYHGDGLEDAVERAVKDTEQSCSWMHLKNSL